MSIEPVFEIEDGVLIGGSFRGVTHVEIPSGVTTVGAPPGKRLGGVFEGRTELESVIIPEGVETIENRTFCRCDHLQQIRLPSTLKRIGNDAFHGCKALKEIIIPDGVEALGVGAFAGCESLTQVRLPAALKIVSSSAFAECKTLERVEFPAGLVQIKEQAFRFCTALKELHELPADAKLDGGVFIECPALVDEAGFMIVNNVLFGYGGTETQVKIPDSVTTISDMAFRDRKDITAVTIPAGVKYIGWRAFANCTGLTEVVLPEGIETVNGFEGCSSLVSINFPASVKEIGSFEGCSALKSVHLPDGIEALTGNNFKQCVSLTDVRLGEGLKQIGFNVFYECTALEEIKIPDSVEKLEGFGGCTALKSINLPAKLRTVDGASFAGCKKIPYLRIPANTRSGWQAFPKEILLVMPGTIGSIVLAEKHQFNKGSSLFFTLADYRMVLNDKFVKLKGVTNGAVNWKIYDNLLAGNECKLSSALLTFAMLCRLRWSVELAEDKKAFFTENVVKNVKKIAPYVMMNPEDDLLATLEEIGAVTAKNKKTLLPLMGIGEAPAPKAKKEEAKVSDGVKTPAQLKKEWTVKKREDGTLQLNSYKGSDTVVEIPAMIGKDAVTALGNECLTCSTYSKATAEQIANRRKVTKVIVPEGIVEIGEETFRGCEELETVILPRSLQRIGAFAFHGCRKLKGLTISADTELGDSVFAACDALEDAQGMIIVNGVLIRCNRGGDVVIPKHVTRLDSNCFNGLLELRTIVFPDGLKALPGRVVKNCWKLQSVTIPPTVVQIGREVFPDWTKLIVYGYTGSCAEELCKSNPNKYEFRSIGVLEREDTEFEITDGVLTRYNGKEKHVTIPAGVRVIGGYAGGNWRKTGAFEKNKTLEKVTIPDTVTAIVDYAFHGCPNLQQVEISDSVEKASKSEFESTPWLYGQPGAVYAGKVLIWFNGASYEQVRKGVREELVVRPGTVAIAGSACWNSASLEKVVLPDTVIRIEDQAFGYCHNLQEMVVPAGVAEVGDSAFETNEPLKCCTGGVLHKQKKLPGKFRYFYTGDVEDTAWLILYQSDKTWAKAVREKLDAVPENISSVMAKMAELIRAAEVLDKNAGNRAAAFALELCRGASADALADLCEALKDKAPAAFKKLDEDDAFKSCLQGTPAEDLSALHPAEALAAANIQHTPAFEKVESRIVEGVPYKGTGELCTRRVLAFVAYAYIRQYDPESAKHISTYETACAAYSFSAAADEVASALDRQKLQEALLQLAEQYGGEYWLPYARYADDKAVAALVSKMREWDTWWKYGATGRRDIIIARSGLLLSNTRAAMLHLDQVGCLGKYAAMRNTDADTIRDTVLSDFGFDKNREIHYDLGSNTVIVRMDQSLSLSIFDTNAGKTMKSIPKKGANPELYEKVKNDFSDLKKNIKKVITNRKKVLFADFLSGEKKDAEKWKQSYLKNPVLNSVAQLMVWDQDGNTFTLTADGAVDQSGAAYDITDKPICVAHPIEMRSEISGWQEYFTSRGLKQPFEQIWEPAYVPEEILPERYVGSKLNVYRLANKEQHGITVWGLRDYSEDYGFELKDCKMEQDASEWRFVHGITDDATFDLGKFTFETFTRQVNHIVYLFDKWTAADRIEKDDVSVVSLLHAFTAAQIRAFIDLANQKNCTNCAALLLDYQNQNFVAFDPMSEFTLDL